MKEFLRMMRQYASPYKKYLGGAVVLNILSAIFNVFSFALVIPILNILFKINDTVYSFIPWDTEGMSIKDIAINNAYWFVSDFSASHGAIFALLLLSAVMIVMTALKTSCYFGASAVMIPIRTGIVKDIRNRMLIKDPILIIVYFGILIYTSPEMMVFTILFVPPFVWVMGVIGKQLKRKSIEAQNLWSDTMSQVEETLGGLRIVKAFNAESKMSKRFDSITESFRKKISRVSTRQALAHPLSEFLGTLMILVVLCFGGSMIIRGKSFFGGSFIDAPTFIFFLIILYSVIEPIKELSKAAYGIPKGLASMERINKILDAESPIKESSNPISIDRLEKGISFKGVNFSYSEGKEILSDINLDIEKGKTIAIVGESGAGKSTLVDLIPRFYDVSSGSITVDGNDIREIKIKDLRNLLGNVNQDPILFNDTIFNNIAFGVENATKEEVIAAAKIANAHDFIMEKEEGYDTNIGDRGIKLSGGQRQRISIARAILKNPPILILDEATASLDTESERAVQEALERLMSSRTTIAIAHRLSTIKNADEIVVMNEGKIVERGRHDELLALGGYYRKLHDMQAL